MRYDDFKGMKKFIKSESRNKAIAVIFIAVLIGGFVYTNVMNDLSNMTAELNDIKAALASLEFRPIDKEIGGGYAIDVAYKDSYQVINQNWNFTKDIILMGNLTTEDGCSILFTTNSTEMHCNA